MVHAPLGALKFNLCKKMLPYYNSGGKNVQETCFCFDGANSEVALKIIQSPPQNYHFFTQYAS